MAQNQKSIEKEIEKNKERITYLEEELKVSRSNEKSLQDEIQSLEKEIQDLKDENAMLGKELEEVKGKIEKLENKSAVQKACKDEEDSVLILVQIGSTIQRNMCEYVLGKYFKNWCYYKFKEINHYIEKFVKPADQESAKGRLKELNNKIAWDQDLVNSLKNLKQKSIGIAHPELSSEKIQQATEFLKERGDLDEEVVENINKLKEQWETSKVLLQTSSAEGQDQGDPKNLSTTGQNQGTPTKETTGNQLLSTKVWPGYILHGN